MPSACHTESYKLCRNKNQSQYSLTDVEHPPCELSNDVEINMLERPLQAIRGFAPRPL